MDDNARQALVDRFRHGDCYPMAAALGERLGLPIRGLVVDTTSDPKYGDWKPHVVHAWAALDDGRGFDAGGPVTDDGIIEEYLTNSSHHFRNVRFETFEGSEDFLVTLRRYFDHESGWSWYQGRFAEGMHESRAALDNGLVDLEEFMPTAAFG